MGIRLVILVGLMVLIGCSRTKRHSNNLELIDQLMVADTLFAPFKTGTVNTSKCLTMSTSFQKKFGMNISNFYEVLQTLTCDFDQDGDKDSVAILGPYFNHEGSCDDCNAELCSHNWPPRRLLLVKSNSRNCQPKIYLYSDLLTNWRFHQGEVEFIEETKNGFIVIIHSGSSIFWETQIYVSMRSGTLMADSVRMHEEGRFLFDTIFKMNVPIEALNEFSYIAMRKSYLNRIGDSFLVKD
jgi:hypothetical protein